MGLYGSGYTANKQINVYFTPDIFVSPPHLEHVASSGVKTDPGLLGLNATTPECWCLLQYDVITTENENV